MTDRREEDLNPLLRRADWRFLLGLPRPVRAFSRAGGTLAEALAVVAEQVVTQSAPDRCDLAVAESPSAATLAELYDALRPGGASYTEWPERRGVRAIEDALRAAGFTGVTCYRLWPRAGSLPAYWVPADCPGAARFVRRRARLRGGRLRRLWAEVRSRVAPGSRRARICAVARRPAGSPAERSGPADWLRDGWAAWGLGAPPERLSTLLVTGGPRSESKVVLLAFAEPNEEPGVAVKAPRIPDAAAGVRREGAVLEALGVRNPAVPGIPRLLFHREIGGVPVVGESALVGRPLITVLNSRNLRPWSLRVAEWLVRLAGRAERRSSADWHARAVDPVLARFVEQFGPVADPGLLRDAEAITRDLGDWPPVPEQRDLGPWNVLVMPTGEPGVLDWESAELDGLPALDLLYYLAYATFAVDRAHERTSRLASYRRSLAPATATGAVRRDCLDRYAEALGLEQDRLGALRVLLWMVHAPSEYRHASADAAGTPSGAALRRSLFLGLWEEEVRAVAGR